jgi:DNA end-binding protein Ku
MPRSIWNGTIAFGLVNVPIKVYSATESKTVHFHEVHLADGARIEHRRICPDDGEQVDYDDIVKGFEVRKGEWVELTDDEIAAAAGPGSRLVDVDHFVPTDDIDPLYYERTYYLGAGDDGEDAYALLHAALDRSGRAAVGRWVFHNRERTVLVRALEDVLALHTMRYADELVDPAKFKLGRVNRKPTKREIEMASALVDGLHTEFDPSEYKDTYRRAVLRLIKRKAEGKEIEPPDEEAPEPSDDLVAALQASMDGRKTGSRRKRAKARA